MAAEKSKRGVVGPLLLGDRPLPHNQEAEMAVLGSMLLDPLTAIDTAAARLNFTNSFFVPAHQQIFTCLVELRNKSAGSAIDLITVANALENLGDLERVGGRGYLTQLLSCVPSAANVEQYAEIVRENAILRRLIRTGADIADRCFDPQESVPELVDEIETEILSLTQLQGGVDSTPIRGLVKPAVAYLEKLYTKDAAVVGITTGYPDLDHLITGLRPGDMFVLAARPSIGKTALALNLATNVALSKTPKAVGVFSLEMSADQLVLRLLCSEARVNMADIKDGALSAARWNDIMAAADRLSKAPLFIDDTGSLDILELRARARRLHQQHHVELLVIDYLQLMRPAGQSRNSTRENEVSQMSGGIKTLAKELRIPIIVLAQLNRQAEQTGQRPKLSHLRESGAIEQDADIVALLHRERETESGQERSYEGTEAELIIAKHRNGPTGIVRLSFFPHWTKFESRSPVSDEDVPRRETRI
jgi:replicative DNA helicase